MPLIKSGSRAAIGENIREMQASGHPHNQAVAAALSNARKYGAKMQGGGFTPPLGERMAARNLMRPGGGFLHSTVPGRTDKLPITVGGGAYILPADHLAAIGQGNSLAGAHIVNKMFGMGPFGMQGSAPRAAHAQQPRLNMKPGKLAAGGHVGKPTPIVAAGGEFEIPPEKIIAKFGDLKKGHEALDKWVMNTRKKHISQLKNLKPPKVD